MLTDTKIKQAKVTDKPYKIYDSEGLYIEVAPTGSKRWRWRYRWNGKEKLLSFGIYPEVPLKLARDRRAAAKELLVSGVDPSQARKEEKVESRAAENSFAAMAEEWYSLYSVPWSEHYKGLVRRRIDEYLIPRLGKRSLSAITPIEIMGILTSLEKRGVIETANRVLGICSQIFRRAVATGKAKSDPCRDLRGALAPAQEKHHAALTTKDGARAVMRALDAYQGSFVVCAAVRFTALTFVRQVELRFATWDEIDWEERMWLIPAERMKMRREHMVPLSRQAIALTRRAIRHSLARNSAHPVLVFSLCWHSICRAPEISLRGFLFRLRAWDTAAPSTAGVCAMTASKKGCTGTDDTQAGSPVLYFRAAHARARLIFDASS